MTMSVEAHPKISIILPTLNAEALLDNCLASVAAQTWPRDRLEILLADAFSRDRTREIARRYGATVIDDPGKNMEEGKRLALRQATGDYIVFVDADNELTHADYFERAVRALEQNPQALGVESYYLPSPKMSGFCAYLTHLLHISDPISWLMSANPMLVARQGEVERWTLPGGSHSYPLGANGFVFRRADLESVKADEHFQDTHVALHLMKAGKREWLRIRGRGVHHYYVQTLTGFLLKRRRAAVHFLRVQEEMPVNWMKEKPPVPAWLAAFYCATLAGPLYHSLRGWIRQRDARWLWHLPASVASLLGVFWGMWTYRTQAGNRRLVADLQVKQSLKSTAPAPAAEGRVRGGASDAIGTAVPWARPGPGRRTARRLHLIANGVFTTSIAGGDIHFLKLAAAAAQAGYELNFFGGHALRDVIAEHRLPGTVTLTDAGRLRRVDQGALGGQLAMFRDFHGRYRATQRLLSVIEPGDAAYAVSDYWFDVLPVVRSAARCQLMVLHMEAPTLKQIALRSRPDVDPKRLASLHYWASQEYALRRFCAARRSANGERRRHLFYLHPFMAPRLRRLGLTDDEITFLSYGLEVGPTEAVPAQPRVYDAVWIGRVHRQKGITDLLATLQFLGGRLPQFRALFIGNVREALAGEIAARGLEGQVEFSGFVTEEEKIRLFKASRCFLMPSRHEGSPRVIGESIIAGTPVVAYEIPNYRPLFGDLVRYAPPFVLPAFQQAAEQEIQRMRGGENYLDRADLASFKRENRWETVQEKFLNALSGAAKPDAG